MRLFRMCAMASGNQLDDRIPYNSSTDRIVFEFALKMGRVDAVIFHVDGSVSIIEAKDGTRGYTHVAQGIGQLSLYAVQFAMAGISGVHIIRRCLHWTSVGSAEEDALLELACEQAGVIPMPNASLKVLLAAISPEAAEMFGVAHG